ncbi:Antiseptic resistance protein [compost metagenome]
MGSQLKQRWWVLGALAVGILAVGLDMTVLNLALPVLATELSATNGQLQWFADAYNLVFAAALLPAGLLGDRLGRKKMLTIGLLVFGISSLVCAFADSPWELITGRVFLGLGAALLVPLSMSIIPVLFSEQERPKAIAVWMTANAFGIPLGPILGGWMLDNFWWGSVFLINIPLVLIALTAVTILLPESRGEVGKTPDLAGMTTSILGLVSVTYGVIEVGEKGWWNAGSIIAITAGIILLVLFIICERKARAPFVDPALFRSRSFTWGTIMATIVSFAMYGVLFVMPQYFQGVKEVDALGAGLRILPLVGGLLIGSQFADRLQTRFGSRITIIMGFSVLGAGVGIGANTGLDSSYGLAAIWLTLAGLGIGFALPAAMDEGMSALTEKSSGVGSALLMALRQVGGTMGVAILGSVLSTGYRNHLDLNGVSAQAAELATHSVSAGVSAAHQIGSSALLNTVQYSFVQAMGTTLWVCGGVVLAGIVMAFGFMRTRN